MGNLYGKLMHCKQLLDGHLFEGFLRKIRRWTMAEEQNVEQFKGQARLPKFAAPKRYDLFLKPDLASCTFSGSVRIALDVVGHTRFLVLNAADLAVKEGSVWFRSSSSSEEIRPVEIVAVEGDEILIIRFDRLLPRGEGVLGIGFQGTLNDKMKGFYRSTYEYKGEKKNMAVTQFEPVDARRCFPCWDEPVCKATFKITLEVPSELVALSNMPVVDEKLDGPNRIVSFEESPIMSTYLVAIVVGLFDYVEASTSDGTKVRVYCQVGKSSQGKFALDVAVKTLDLYKKYFAVPYPLPKLDMVAIPDFAAGAMENYGLVTYRETALLFDDRHSAASNKQRVAIVVAHELAHQWFGNLVTMEWWTHLWLNEGFATWVSYLAADSLFPEWNVWTQFLDETTTGLRLDALTESHPIEVDINHASEIEEIFDAISYKKGASVIRMLQSYLGAECFQKALASYIKKFAYSNAKTEDLWAVLEKESGEPVKKLMHSWTKQKGYPVLSVKVRDGNLEFEQTQFLSSGSSGVGQWIVPITLCCCSYKSQEKFLLETKSDKMNLTKLCDSFDSGKGGKFWIKVNVNQTGFYRVNYDDELASKLRYAIESHQLTATDRFGVLDDSFALSMACKQTLSSLLSLMAAYKEESEYTVLSHIITTSYKVVDVVADAAPELVDDIKTFFISLLQYPAEKLGWDPKDGESHLDAMLRGEILTALAEFGHDITINEAVKRFHAFMEDRDTSLLPPDTRKAAYVALMKTVNNSNKVGYESLLRIYRETDLSQEKVRILSALASSPDPSVVLEALNFLLSSEVRNQDAVHGLAGISREGRDVAWMWLKENWEHISKTWGSGFLITRFISSIVSPFSSDEKGDEIENFFATRSKPSISRTLKQSIERVRVNAKWVKSIQSETSLGEVVEELAYRIY
ncbi:aminopeptidase M1-like [Ananas comosus]|uniref:Aminopeptidase n=1 Tax=Ananas comosus TaxID=4615 RepID=A0A6P5EZ17_ANACO|nr:aminopeptidase M1-like [Ananas comosus]